jgi:hypothetical protein
MEGWSQEEVLITVRAYPEPSTRHVETSCVAGITADGHPRRLFPIPDRLLQNKDKFSKFDVVRVRVQRPANDGRPESRKVDLDQGIEKVATLHTTDGWHVRDRWIEPLRAPSLEALDITVAKDVPHRPSLGLIRPKSVEAFEIVSQSKTDWDAGQKAKLAQQPMFLPKPIKDLEFIPYKFYYTFHCDDDSCKGHRMSVIDWEMLEAYRRWSRDYGDQWQVQFKD